MADVFSDTLSQLVRGCPGLSGAVFADFDGEEIALHPPKMAEDLRLCAVYGGIAMRRLSAAEARTGQGPIKSVVVRGADRTLVSLRVSDGYQLVLTVEGATPPARVIDAAREAVEIIEQNI